MNLSGSLIVGLLITLVFGAVGYLLKIVVWKSKKIAVTNIDYARKFASQFLFFSALGAGHFFIKSNVIEAIVQTIITIIFFGFVGFVIGYLYSDVIKNKNLKIISGLIILVVVLVITSETNDEFNRINETEYDMHFSTKFALLYAIAGFVANAY